MSRARIPGSRRGEHGSIFLLLTGWVPGTNGTGWDAVAVAPEGEANGNIVVGLGATAPALCVYNKDIITGTISAFDPSKIPPHAAIRSWEAF